MFSGMTHYKISEIFVVVVVVERVSVALAALPLCTILLDVYYV
jgi:hypothetical protein